MNSVFYIQKSNEPLLNEFGDNLGDMTNDLRPREYIDEFVSGGPKNYAYKVVNSTINKTKTIISSAG